MTATPRVRFGHVGIHVHDVEVMVDRIAPGIPERQDGPATFLVGRVSEP